MDGDTTIAAATTEQTGATPGDTQPSAPSALSLFCESEDLGVGAGKSERRRAEESRLMAVLGAKLRRARKAAGMSESAAGLALAQEGVTMISLYENGHRLPSLSNIRLLAQLYGVTTDYLLDMHDDIVAVPEEGNQAVIRGIISTALVGEFGQFVDAMARRNSIMIEALSLDRALLSSLAVVATDLVSALNVIKTHAPEFEEIRGGAKLVRLVGELHVSMSEQIRRRAREEAMANYEPYYPAPEQIVKQVQQILF
ncbi:helix-turn-helix domain-containing protein [Pseudomonas sp. UMAB-40]|uniref:helix-turn-helix domain-containing protein n=1 Tax=Pseudomonas sp. UMAB-40 TaxID=1365407 RepID=UPI001C55BE5D|nr:helix-turn-helix transcriptional regulator [Pseudomonas sp. UMAB-40]